MEHIKRTLLLGIELALLVIFTSGNLLLFVWQNILGYYLLITLASLLGGAALTEFDISLKLVSIAYIAGCMALILVYTLPIMLYGGTPAELNAAVAFTTVKLSKTFLISFPLSIFVCLFGCFLGKALAETR